MKTTGADPLAVILILAGLLAASLPISPRDDQAEVLPQAVHHKLVEQQVRRIIRILDRAERRIFGDVCSSSSDEDRDRSSHARMSPAIVKLNGDQLDLFGAAPLFGSPGRPAPASGCPSRHCLADATFVGCCGAFRVVGTDRLGECSVLQRCF
jgi:hypothetical protein